MKKVSSKSLEAPTTLLLKATVLMLFQLILGQKVSSTTLLKKKEKIQEMITRMDLTQETLSKLKLKRQDAELPTSGTATKRPTSLTTSRPSRSPTSQPQSTGGTTTARTTSPGASTNTSQFTAGRAGRKEPLLRLLIGSTFTTG